MVPGPDGRAAASLAVVMALVFARALLTPAVFFERDIHSYWYPHIETAVRAVTGGAWPVWNPYVAFGRPLLADPNFELLYPPTWLNLVVSPAVYYKLFVLGHCWAAAFGLYLLARRCALSPLPATVAGALWGLSGPLVSAANLFHHFAGAAWMPWVLLAMDRALVNGTWRAAVVLGAVAGGQALAGSADMCLLTALAAALQAAMVLWRADSERRTAAARLARTVAVAVPFAALLAAAQWLPAAALARASARAAHSLETSAAWSVHPASLADLLVPSLLADLPMSDAVRAAVFDGRGPLLDSLYLGAAAAALAALALAAGKGSLPVWAAAGLVFFLLAALGRHAPVYPVLWKLPAFGMLRYPAKYMIPAALFWALLAGAGLQAWLRPWSARERTRARLAGGLAASLWIGVAAVAEALRRWPASVAPLLGGPEGAAADPPQAIAPAILALRIAAGTGLAATLLIAFRRREAAPSRSLTALVSLLVVADVLCAARGVNALAPPALLAHKPPLAARLGAEGPAVRLYVRNVSGDRANQLLVRGPGGFDSDVGWALGAQQMLLPPIGARWRLRGSYDGDFTGLAPRALTLLGLALPAAAGGPLPVKLLRLAGVTHVVSLGDPAFPGLEPLDEFPSVYAIPLRLSRVPEPLPWAYVVGSARALDEERSLRALVDLAFDPRREVLLPPDATVGAGPPAGFTGNAGVTSTRMDALDVEADLSAPGWLVLLEAYDRGWTARVDGEPAPVLPGNLLFRAVPLPAGRHRVELRYQPPGLALGASASALAVAGAIATWSWRRRRVADVARREVTPAIGSRP